jgi:hypothetical protein
MDQESNNLQSEQLNKVYHVGTVAISFGIFLILILRLNTEDNFSQDLLFLLMTYLTGINVYQYILSKNKTYLVASIGSFLALSFALFNVLIYYGYITY